MVYPADPNAARPGFKSGGLPTPAVITHTQPLTSPPSISSTKSSQWAQAYNLWLNSRTSPHTRRAYSSAWTSFQDHSGKLPWEITRADIARWLDAQRAAGLSASTINQRLAALSSFFTYASQVYQIAYIVGAIKNNHHSCGEVAECILQCEPDDETGDAKTGQHRSQPDA